MIKLLTFFLTVMIGIPAFSAGIGPIPQGVYKGKMTCFAKNYDFEDQSTFVIGKNTMETIGTAPVDFKKFIPQEGDRFLIESENGAGSGHFLDDGIYFKYTFKGMAGEDRFRYHNQTLYLTGSVIANGDVIICAGIYHAE